MILPYAAYLADIGRRLTLRLRFGPGYDLSRRALCWIGNLALRKGWRHNHWPGSPSLGTATRVSAIRPDGTTFGTGNPWRDMSPAISLAAAISLASR